MAAQTIRSAALKSSGIKAPERCPHCNSTRLIKKGSRTKKLETVAMMKCKACGRTFTPGPRALRNKTYPLAEILEAITTYNLGHSLSETRERLSSRYGHAVSAATISRWVNQHQELTTYSRLRSAGRLLHGPRRLIRTSKLYHRQVYEFAYHRAKLDLLRTGMLDPFIESRSTQHFQRLADFIESIPSSCPHDLSSPVMMVYVVRSLGLASSTPAACWSSSARTPPLTPQP